MKNKVSTKSNGEQTKSVDDKAKELLQLLLSGMLQTLAAEHKINLRSCETEFEATQETLKILESRSYDELHKITGIHPATIPKTTKEEIRYAFTLAIEKTTKELNEFAKSFDINKFQEGSRRLKSKLKQAVDDAVDMEELEPAQKQLSQFTEAYNKFSKDHPDFKLNSFKDIYNIHNVVFHELFNKRLAQDQPELTNFTPPKIFKNITSSEINKLGAGQKDLMSYIGDAINIFFRKIIDVIKSPFYKPKENKELGELDPKPILERGLIIMLGKRARVKEGIAKEIKNLGLQPKTAARLAMNRDKLVQNRQRSYPTSASRTI